MTSKKPFLSLQNDKYNFGNGKSIFDNDQYRNLNLNKHQRTPLNDIIRSKSSSSPDSRKSDLFNDNTMEESNDRLKTRKITNEFKIHDFSMEFDDSETEKDKKCDDKNCSTNSSTLSLRIASYENSIDAMNVNERNEFSSKWKNAKVADSIKTAQNPFVFPPQKQNERSKAEVMEFKASQELLNPQQRPVVKYPESESNDEEAEYEEIRKKSLQSRVVVVASKSKKSKTSEKEEMKLFEEKRKIRIEKERFKKHLTVFEKECHRAIELEKRILNEIRERINDGRVADTVLLDDLKYAQKRSFNALKEHSNVCKEYQALKDDENIIYQKLRDLDHREKKR
uniref:Uncharacterized protein n=1 Tax=Panagrolaimus superbus TaxID=310955 RepID=A0A914YPM2_9BILA